MKRIIEITDKEEKFADESYNMLGQYHDAQETKGKWLIKVLAWYHRAQIDKALEEGYEPFAVTPSNQFGTTVDSNIWLRKYISS